jgi:SAM-dependent methyltransferase
MFRSTASAMEAINRRTWRSAEALRWYARIDGYLDAGERACLESLRAQAREQPILDLGVGGGRTTALLLPLTGHYVGLDHTPQMLELCRRRFPGAQLQEGDARDLSRFADGSMELVVFSYNGIDLMHDEDRAKVLREIFRVLRPGGAFYFSTIHRDGPDFRRRPFFHPLVFSWNPVRLAWRVLHSVVGTVRGQIRRARLRRYEEHHPGHSVLLHDAHDYGLLVYATSVGELRAQLGEAGFVDVQLVGTRSGRPVVNGDASAEPYLHVVARKPR